MMRQGPTASVLLSTDLGETKIPEPMMVPTMMQMPLSRPTSDVEEGRRVNATRDPAQMASRSPVPPSIPPSGVDSAAPSKLPSSQALSPCAVAGVTPGL